ncbi:unnamed protein product, partial [Didymodactylos carnosus]
NGILKFSPNLQLPFVIPVLIPNTLGSLTVIPVSNERSSYTLTLSFGNLLLNIFSVNDAIYPGIVNLTAG